MAHINRNIIKVHRVKKFLNEKYQARKHRDKFEKLNRAVARKSKLQSQPIFWEGK